MTPAIKGDILIVDDTPHNLRLLSTMLTDQGYKVRKAINGQIALQGVNMIKPDLILLDINMPDVNGYEVCKKLKTFEQTKDIPVIFISAIDETLDKVKAFDLGGVDYITKPFQVKEVLARVENHLTLNKLRRQLYEQNLQMQLEISERQRSEEEMRFLLTTTQLISKSVNFDDALEITLHQICDMIGWDLGEAWIPNDEILSLKYSRGWYASDRQLENFVEQSKNFTFAPSIGLPGKIWLSKKLEWIEDISIEPEPIFMRGQIALEVGLKTALGIPIIANDQVLTILAFFKKEQSKPEQRLIDIVQAVATQLSSLIQLKKTEAALVKANQELELLATLDSLTGIANRRRFDEFLCREWLRLFREKLPLSLIICDVDYFKPYNDTYGHLAGDFCLQEVARTIDRCIKRPADLAARYGGEEFAVILPNTDAEGAFHVAELIRQQVERLKITHANSEVSEYVTLSLGVTSVIPNPEVNPDTLIAIADKALYSAKQQGRNSVVVEDLIILE